MGPKRKSTKDTLNNSRTKPYDTDLLENWTATQLREELERKNIPFRSNSRRAVLIRSLRQAEQRIQDGGDIPIDLGMPEVDAPEVVSHNAPTSHDNQQNGGVSHNAPTSHDNQQNGGVSHNAPTSHDIQQNGGAHNSALVDMVTSLCETVTILKESYSRVENKLDQMSRQTTTGTSHASIEQPRRQLGQPSAAAGSPAQLLHQQFAVSTLPTHNPAQSAEFTLDSAYRRMTYEVPEIQGGNSSAIRYEDSDRSLGQRPVRTAYGYAAHSLPLVETVSPVIRQNIISGRDVNLASLLIPYYNGHESDSQASHDTKHDPRMNRTLTIGEFITAFGVYKQIMCSVHQHRRVELDTYERDIIDMATRYNKGFYEYHRQFALQAASQLRYNNIPVDWSIRDNTLFCNIFANIRPNACNICQSSLHTTGFCPSSLIEEKSHAFQKNVNHNRNPATSVASTDSHGRHRAYHEGRQICNNFNGDTGCRIPSCFYHHVCLQCKGAHSKSACPLFKRSPLTKKR